MWKQDASPKQEASLKTEGIRQPQTADPATAGRPRDEERRVVTWVGKSVVFRGDLSGSEDIERRHADDRRSVPRGGRRTLDVPGRYPPVLVADSDDGARQPCVRYLDRFGFQVEEATTGNAAVAIIEMCHPHVVIAELTLPHDDEFQARVRAHSIPYIVTVTNDVGFVPPDAATVLMKPFPLAALLKEVRRALTCGNGP